jgi:hypothetical protein
MKFQYVNGEIDRGNVNEAEQIESFILAHILHFVVGG